MNSFRFTKVTKTLSKKEQDLQKLANRYEFEIHDLDLAIINGIRRVILSDIPTLGFMGENDVSIQIHKNTGPLHNEFMTHRIGLIPMHFTEEETEGFVENEYQFTLNVKNNQANLLNVTTADIKGKRNAIELSQIELKRIFPMNPVTKMPVLITRLRQGEEFSFTATVVKSTAKVHASFSPVSLCSFYYLQNDALNQDVKDILQRERNYHKNEYGDPTALLFSIEPELGLTPKYLVAKALEILRTKAETVDRELETNASQKVMFEKNPDIADTYDLHIQFEDDTFGNLFQSLVYNEYIRANKKILDDKFTMSYIGYYAPHPLDPKIVIRMTLKNDENISATPSEFKTAFKTCLRLVNHTLKDVYDAWIRFD